VKKSFSRGSLLASSFISTWRKKYREYATLCLTSGFIPTTFLPLQFIARLLARLWLFIQVGRVRVVGADNLSTSGRIIFCPNHSSMLDAILIYAIMKRWPRYMTAYEEMRGVGGLKAIVMGAFGSFPVDRTQGKTVLEPAIKVLMSGQPMVLFPEGKISPTGEYLPFKRGAAVIANSTYERLAMKEPVAIVPIHICYHKRDVTSAGGPYSRMGLKWRGGVTVTVGKPIYIHELPSRKPEDVMAVVRGAVKLHSCHTTPGDKLIPPAASALWKP
jgi:1-acyl-sn-glycerol-3-phosphate acyltransferase